jgi:hypothetical protein
MKTSDTAMMRSTIAPGTMMGGVPRPGRPVQFSAVDGWLKSIGAAKPGSLEERLFDPEVRVDDGLASIWIQYTFLIDGKVSHCGVDAIQLVRTGEGWKITALADSRRTTGCRT